MNPLSRELRDMGYEQTEQESPFIDGGMLWTNSYELVCDKTAIVIRKDNSREDTVHVSDDEELEGWFTETEEHHTR